MEKADLTDLTDLGEVDLKIELKKIESPVGNKLPWRKGIDKDGKPRKRKTSCKIVLAKPIQVGKKIIKWGEEKNRKSEIKKKFYATLSSVRKIERIEEKEYFVLTDNSKYLVTLL